MYPGGPVPGPPGFYVFSTIAPRMQPPMFSVPARLARTAARQVLILASVLGAVSCGGDNRGVPGAERRGSAEWIHNGETGRWKPGEAWRLTQQARIGSDQSGGPDMFGQILDLAIDPLGRVWVADGHAQQIRVFEANGRHVRTIGRKGGGPSEFAQLAGMDFAPDGRLWVQDPGNSRWAVFDTSGALVATHIRPAGVSIVPWPGGFDRAGRLYDVGVVPADGGEVAQAIVRLGTDLSPSDTLPLPPFQADFFEVASVDRGNRSVQRANVPFTGSQVWRVDPEGSLWTAVTDRYRLYRHRPGGDTARVVEREQRPVAVTAPEMAEMVDSYQWFTDLGGKLDRSRIPDSKPPLNGFFFSPDGYLWTIPSRASGEPASFDIFDPAGKYLGRIAGAEGLLAAPVPVIRDGLLAAVAQDTDGVPLVILMRIEKPAP